MQRLYGKNTGKGMKERYEGILRKMIKQDKGGELKYARRR